MFRRSWDPRVRLVVRCCMGIAEWLIDLYCSTSTDLGPYYMHWTQTQECNNLRMSGGDFTPPHSSSFYVLQDPEIENMFQNAYPGCSVHRAIESLVGLQVGRVLNTFSLWHAALRRMLCGAHRCHYNFLMTNWQSHSYPNGIVVEGMESSAVVCKRWIRRHFLPILV